MYVVLAACGGGGGAGEDAAVSPPVDARVARQVQPGIGIGEVTVGATYAELRARLGELEELSPFNRIILGAYPALGLELMLASGAQTTLSEDAVLISVALRGPSPVPTDGAQPGWTRAQIEAVLGVAPESLGEYAYYPDGISVAYGDGDRADAVAVFAPYTLAPVPPPMTLATP